jgi:hypothetical protein
MSAYHEAARRLFAASGELGRHSYNLGLYQLHVHPFHWSEICADACRGVLVGESPDLNLDPLHPTFMGVSVVIDPYIGETELVLRVEVKA